MSKWHAGSLLHGPLTAAPRRAFRFLKNGSIFENDTIVLKLQWFSRKSCIACYSGSGGRPKWVTTGIPMFVEFRLPARRHRRPFPSFPVRSESFPL